MILNRSALIFMAIIAAITIIVPILNLAMPESSPLHVPTYIVSLFGKYLTFALLALSVDLIGGSVVFSAWVMAPFLLSAATPWACI